MPKISLWGPNKGNNYNYEDRVVRSYIDHSGTGVYVHKYIGPSSGGDETTIDDLLFLENRSRKYDDDIYEMRGTYQPQSSDFNLSQFGIFISNDTIFMIFHYNDMLDKIGRKLMSGDVLELPHLQDPDTLDPDTPTTRKYYTVTEGAHASEGFGVTWFSHLWRVKAKITPSAPEYAGISGGDNSGKMEDFGLDLAAVPLYSKPGTILDSDGNVVGEVCCDGDVSGISGHDGIGSAGNNNSNGIACDPRAKKDQEITDGIIAAAYADVRFDPKQFDAAHLWVQEDPDTGKFRAYSWSGDGLPANGYELYGSGEEFPDNAPEQAFFLRTDFDPARLYRKNGSIWTIIEKDFRKMWTPYNKVLDSFIDNRDTDIMTDGSVVKTKKALSKTVKPKVNLHQSKEDDINKDGKK